MAALFGRLHGSRGEVTRCGTRGSGIQAKLETWNGSISVFLNADGDFTVYIGDKSHPTQVVAEGNVDHRVFVIPSMQSTATPQGVV